MLQHLKELRRYMGLSQAELAEKLQVSRQSYNHYEIGDRNPPLDILVRLADVLDVSTDYLLNRTEYPELYSGLTDDEAHVVELYRRTGQAGRYHAYRFLLEEQQQYPAQPGPLPEFRIHSLPDDT